VEPRESRLPSLAEAGDGRFVRRVPMNVQEMVMALDRFWAARGCAILQPYDIETGAGTMNPATFLRALGPEPWRVAYVEPSRRPADGRYGENPNRLYQHVQYQVLLKPSPDDVQEVYLDSIRALGIDLARHDLRFVEDDWEAPTLGAWGIGWEVWLDGNEITQFTYFQQVGGYDTSPVPVELTYGVERLATYIQGVNSVFDLEWAPGTTYGEIYRANEYEQSSYGFDQSDVEMLFALFDMYEKEASRVADRGLVLPAYEYALKCSHTFNLLEARGAISVTERTSYIGRVRSLARRCAREYVAQREKMGYPLLPDHNRAEVVR